MLDVAQRMMSNLSVQESKVILRIWDSVSLTLIIIARILRYYPLISHLWYISQRIHGE